MNLSSFFLFFRRLKNLASREINRAKFSLHGVLFGENFCVHGHCGLLIKKDAKITIGSDFYMSNGNHINPLCRNLEGGFFLNEKAELSIGIHVGMSSTAIWCNEKIFIGNNVNIGANTIIVDSDCHSLNYLDRRNLSTDMKLSKNAPIEIGDDVMIGMNCLILKGVKIGCRSVIGAGSVVSSDIPADSIAAGNPARVIRKI